MSLLLDALKKASDAKAGVDSSSTTTEDDLLEPVNAGNTPSPHAHDEDDEVTAVIISDDPAPTADPRNERGHAAPSPAISNPSALYTEASPAKAETIFTSKGTGETLPRRPNLWLILLFMLFISLLGGIVYLYYIQKDNELKTHLRQTRQSTPIVPIEKQPIPLEAVNESPLQPLQSPESPIQSAPTNTGIKSGERLESIATPPVNSQESEPAPQPQISPNPPTQTPVTEASENTPQAPVKQPPVSKKNSSSVASPAITMVKKATALPADQLVSQAYQAYQHRDFTTARQLYEQALSTEQSHYDALRGKAAVATLQGDTNTAFSTYRTILQYYPDDPAALANLTQYANSLEGNEVESELKLLLNKSPNSAPLNFALGNLYSQQQRWADAQASYFKAYASESNNPDYAYNLAISLDNMGKAGPAKTYYQEALEKAALHPSNFDLSLVYQRLAEIR
ncbi:MAG: tetratricopeptide repeat protein [Gammaproteobacteria bacterium]|nr:tetratricopeptide repeat protein [Gammaproteobacteria bacterium]